MANHKPLISEFDVRNVSESTLREMFGDLQDHALKLAYGLRIDGLSDKKLVRARDGARDVMFGISKKLEIEFARLLEQLRKEEKR